MSVLCDSLKNKLIPWSHQNAAERFIVARKKMRSAQMPDGVRLVRRKVEGPRIIVKNRRLYGNTRGLKAYWPEAKFGEWGMHTLACVLDGHVDFQLGNYAVQCGAGFYLVIPPNTVAPKEHPYYAKVSFCDVLFITLHPHAMNCSVVHGQQGQDYSESYLLKNENLSMLFNLLMQEVLDERRDSIPIAADLLATFWRLLERDIEEKHYINPGPVSRPIPELENRASFEAELLHYIQTHITGALKLEDAARALYLSRTQFVRKMRLETGKTYIQFLTDYRITEAKVLLRDSDWTISAIAGFLGFNTSSYFQKVFRRETQQTPSEYRQSIR